MNFNDHAMDILRPDYNNDKILNISFEDRFVNKFIFDLEEYKLELFFNGYTDHTKGKNINNSSVLTIGGWKIAQSKSWSDTRWVSIEDYLGIIKMVLKITYDGEVLEMEVNTLDERYVSIKFTGASIEFNEIDDQRI